MAGESARFNPQGRQLLVFLKGRIIYFIMAFVVIERIGTEGRRENDARSSRHGDAPQDLKSTDWEKRFKATEVLGKLRRSRAVKPLIEALKDEDEYVREGAAWALGEIRPQVGC